MSDLADPTVHAEWRGRPRREGCAMSEDIRAAETHPVQGRDLLSISSKVTLRAYEVYRFLNEEQRALIQGECRGGFSTGELIAFLYARSFPEHEWKARVDEAFRWMKTR